MDAVWLHDCSKISICSDSNSKITPQDKSFILNANSAKIIWVLDIESLHKTLHWFPTFTNHQLSCSASVFFFNAVLILLYCCMIKLTHSVFIQLILTPNLFLLKVNKCWDSFTSYTKLNSFSSSVLNQETCKDIFWWDMILVKLLQK